MEPAGNRVTRVRVERLPAPPSSRSDKPESHTADDFRVVRVPFDLILSTSDGDQRSSVLSLPAPDVLDFSSYDEPAEVAGTSVITPAGIHKTRPTRVSGTAPFGLSLEASALEDYKLAHKAFSELLFSADANKLLHEPRKMIRKRTVKCFIQVSRSLLLYFP